MTRLSVVAPVYNEAAILPELARRCVDAARQVDPEAEVILVDDASTDGTRALAPTLPATVLHLPENRRQLRATQAGLAAAQGEMVVVIDGDLQDPPEVIPALVAALHDDLDVVFAVKHSRQDPWWFHVGRAAYALLLALPGARAVPPGAGAYCVMRREVARRAAGVRLPDGNLAPLLIALGVRHGTVSYAKGPRYDGQSRVGLWGLVAEAIPSLVLTGAIPALLGWSAVACALAALVLPPPLPATLLLLAASLSASALALGWRARRVLARPAEMCDESNDEGASPDGGRS